MKNLPSTSSPPRKHCKGLIYPAEATFPTGKRKVVSAQVPEPGRGQLEKPISLHQHPWELCDWRGGRTWGKRQPRYVSGLKGIVSRRRMQEPVEDQPWGSPCRCVGIPTALSAEPTHPPRCWLPGASTRAFRKQAPMVGCLPTPYTKRNSNGRHETIKLREENRQ